MPTIVQATPTIASVAADPDWVYDWAFEHFVPKVRERIAEGWRVLSLSQYGEGQGVRFAALFDKRPGPPLDWLIGWSQKDFQWAVGEKLKAGYYPIHVTATGGGPNANFSAIFEQRAPDNSTEITFDLNPIALEGPSPPGLVHLSDEVKRRAFDGWIPVSATIHDDAGHAPRVAVVWERNKGAVGWNLFAGKSHDEFQHYFEQQWSVWGRLAFATGSTRNLLLAIYRDDHLAQIGRGFVARHALVDDEFKTEREKWLAEGFWPVCLQGYGKDADRRFAAIFVSSETLVKRTLRRTGSAGVQAIDDAVTDLMEASSIRGAALAIVDGTRLVYARGYSWAEPDYPEVLPTTCFRLASVSKIVAALGIHQLVAEGGHFALGDPLPQVLPLTNPDGTAPTNTAYLNATVQSLLEYGGFFHRYEHEYANVAAAFHTTLPVTHEMIARHMLTVPVRTQPNDRLDDFGYFLAGEIIKRHRGQPNLMAALADRLLKPLHLKRLRPSRALLAHQPADEARYHPRDLGLGVSLMTAARPIVPVGYGDEHFETRECSGGLSAAVVDFARILAAMNAKPYSPLGRPAVDSLLSSGSAPGRLGHGFDRLERVGGRLQGPKGGELQTSQSGAWFREDGLCTVVVWNGQHTGSNLTKEGADGAGWYPSFDRVLNAAAGVSWPTPDLFPDYGMPSLPTTESGWRYCKKCQGMFFVDPGKVASCPAGGTHDGGGSFDYLLMRDSSFAYGQDGWRRCFRCQGLWFTGHGGGSCPAQGLHSASGSPAYTVVLDSPYKEAQQGWRWCRKCEGMLYAGFNHGVCPAGGAHDPAGSGHYGFAHN